MGILYFVVFALGFAYSDLGAIQVATIGAQSVYAIDVLNAAAIALAVLFCFDGGLARLTRAGQAYCIFLGWLVVELLIGATRYGGAAVGEFRYVLPLFWFFVPLAVEGLRRTSADTEYATVPLNVIRVAALAGVAMLMIEVMHGGRYYFSAANQAKSNFADFRGARFLDSYQTFNIAFASAIATLWGLRTRRFALIPLGVALFALAGWTQNRTALIAVVAGLLLLAVLERRFGMLAAIGAVGAFGIALVMLLAPDLLRQLTSSYSAALSPAADDSGAWRLYIQLQAFSQALQTPILGQGYGGYFRFEIPGREAVLAPPHNQFLLLFLKGGSIAVVLVLVAMTAYLATLWKKRAGSTLSDRERIVVEALLLLVLAQFAYGMAYDFVLTFGLMLGCSEVLLTRSAARAAATAETTSSRGMTSRVAPTDAHPFPS